MKHWWVGSIILVLVGCNKADDRMPLAVGNTWSAHSRDSFRELVESIKVTRSISVAGVSGFELSGPLGVSRIAFRDGRLVADQLGITRFSPPIPLLLPGPSAQTAWTGTVASPAGSESTEARLDQIEDKLEIDGKKVNTTKTVLTFKIRGKDLELTTWFRAGIGIARQEQRLDGKLIVSFDTISGP
ncbi:MAG: hypothetical protein JST35_09580 [Armatimonadetes bacterium]|nr:hypothetical protein [Armatimonadota bacterium]